MRANDFLPRRSSIQWIILPLALVATEPAQSATQEESKAQEQAQVTVDSNGITHLPAMAIPFSSLTSPQAKKAFLDLTAHPLPVPSGPIEVPGPAIDKYRQDMDREIFLPYLQKNLARYPVKIEPRWIGGVYTDVITPKDGVSAKNAGRVLINVHGGGFVMGARIYAQVESVPIAGTGQFKVVTVDYRMAPEHKFPAASEDVAAVYRELLKEYEPENIGIFGCSAGGMLTAQAVAWFQKENLPAPGAIAILCAGGVDINEGDSGFLWPHGLRPTPGSPRKAIGYLEAVNPHDPLAYPASSLEVLRKFPPTLILTSTRAFDLSPAVHTDIQLTKAGVISELHVWDGLGHGAFLADPDVPEVRDAGDFIVDFFDRHLGR